MTDLETRLAFLPQLAEVLANSTSYGAIYAGYEDGDFLLVRKLTERARGAGGASTREPPAGPEPASGTGRVPLFRPAAAAAGAAPHAGLPFRSARSGLVQGARWSTGIIVTHPYLFFTTREPGMTLAVESDDRRAVIGLDAGVEGSSHRRVAPARSQPAGAV
jgi:hypothetical protein